MCFLKQQNEELRKQLVGYEHQEQSHSNEPTQNQQKKVTVRTHTQQASRQHIDQLVIKEMMTQEDILS